MPGTLGELFDDMMWTTTSVFIKALATNDDSGRHGVLGCAGPDACKSWFRRSIIVHAPVCVKQLSLNLH